MRVALLSAEVSPFVGGGIAPMVRATAQVLAAAGHQVDLITRGVYRSRAAHLAQEGHGILAHPNIHWYWTREPSNGAETWHRDTAESFADTLRQVYARARPDLVELQDYQGLGAAVAAERGGGALGDAPVVTRLNTSWEQIQHLDGAPSRATIDQLERAGLLASDLLLAPSAAVETFYRDFYDGLALPELQELWPGFLRDDAPLAAAPRAPHRGLDLLYVGRLQRLKGVEELVRAVVDQPELDVRLTLVGDDTLTAPGGTSMRGHLGELAAGDARVKFLRGVSRVQLGDLYAAHDAVVVPSHWEAWGNVALEALAAARPLLVTPAASLPRIAGDGRFGLVAAGHSADDIAALLRDAVQDRERLIALGGDPALTHHLDQLTDADRVVAGYTALAERRSPAQPRSLDAWIAEAGVAVSAELQTVFAGIYAQETWTDKLPGMPRSGRGSLTEYSVSVIDYLTEQIASGAVRSIADIGCGDLTFMKEIAAVREGAVDYTGYDIVPALIAEHRQLGWGEFHVADVTHEDFHVAADLVLVKDVLFHLANHEVVRALEHLKACEFKQLLITSLDVDTNEPRTFDRWHFAPLNLELPPFSLTSSHRLPRDSGWVHVYTPDDLS